MAVIKAVSSRASIGTAINYITKEEKTEERLISGIDCSPGTAINEMKATKAVWKKTDGRQYKHYVQSFPPDEKITPQEAHVIANELCVERFKGFEIIIATHKDKNHIHSHIIVNSVNFKNGKKIQESEKDLQCMKDYSDALCRSRGFSIVQKNDEITAYSKNKYRAIERGAKDGGYKSYLIECYKAVNESKKAAINRSDFIEKLQKSGYNTNWSDNRKYITFTDKDGNKIRNSNLEKTFKEPLSKEELENGFKSNLERKRGTELAREQLRAVRTGNADTGTTTDNSGAGTEDTNAIIKQFNATIAKSRDDIKSDDSQRANRIANEQSRQRERNRVEEQKITQRSPKSHGHGR